MTKEEIIDGLKFTVDMFLFNPSTGETYTEPRNDMDKITIDACKGAIELLEQEPVLDKIRAEIEEKARPNEIGGRGNGKSIRYGLCMALKIIDKYKAESEE